MEYEYHVFLSYRRYGRWPEWTKKIFVPIFTHWLGEELGENVEIFFDEDMETGVTWPPRLVQALARSRILVPLFSRQYFNSSWCRLEFSYMLAREKYLGLRTAEQPSGLIIPAIIHDGNDLPRVARWIQAARLEEYSNAFMLLESENATALSALIKRWVPDIVRAIRRAPPYDPTFVNIPVDKLTTLDDPTEPRQDIPPSLGIL